MMKKIPVILIALFPLLSCTQAGPVDTEKEILPSSGLVVNCCTRSSVDGVRFPSEPAVYAVTACRGAGLPMDGHPSYFDNAFVDNVSGKNTFSTPRYYPSEGDSLYFYAYAPVSDAEGLSGRQYHAGSGNTAPWVQWKITGQEDIMSSQVVNGISKTSSAQPDFLFRHLLKKLRFEFLRGEGFPNDVVVEQLEVTHCRTAASLDLFTGILTFEDRPEHSLVLSSLAAGVGEGGIVPAVIMNEPGRNVKLKITTRDHIVYLAEFTLQGHKAGQAGVSHDIALTFTPKGLELSASVSDWEDGGTQMGILQ